MESVVTAYSLGDVFHGGRPTNIVNCHRELRLAKDLAADMSLDVIALHANGMTKTRPN